MSPGTVVGEIAESVKGNATILFIMGIATIFLGVLAMMCPLVSGAAVSMLVGFLLIAAGVARSIFAFKAESWGKGILAFVLGALTVIIGGVMLARPLLGLASLTLVLAGYFFIDGLFEIFGSFKLKPTQGWGWMLFGGIVSVLLAVLIMRQWPVSGAWAIGILVGIKLIFTGTAMTMLGSVGRRAAGAVQDRVEAAT